MLDDQELEYHIKELMIDICEVLYRKGYDKVSVGAMMRLVGVGNGSAEKHDLEYFALDNEFAELLISRQQKTIQQSAEKPPIGTTLH